MALDKAFLREDFLGNNIRPQDHLQKADSATRFVDIVLRRDLARQLVKRAKRGLSAPPESATHCAGICNSPFSRKDVSKLAMGTGAYPFRLPDRLRDVFGRRKFSALA
ncbi:hypothetical protein N9L70_04540 [Rhodobacteraceae bacterium]|nr:hypothetical protein [Paracoccaceae bacterium]